MKKKKRKKKRKKPPPPPPPRNQLYWPKSKTKISSTSLSHLLGVLRAADVDADADLAPGNRQTVLLGDPFLTGQWKCK